MAGGRGGTQAGDRERKRRREEYGERDGRRLEGEEGRTERQERERKEVEEKERVGRRRRRARGKGMDSEQ